MRRNPGTAVTKCCKTARLREAADLIDQRRERRKTNGGREKSSEWGTTGGNEASARDNRRFVRFVRVDLGRSQQEQNKLRPSTSWCSCQPCGDSTCESLAPLSLSLSLSLALTLHPLAVAPALLFSFSFPSTGLQRLEPQPGGGDRNRSLDPYNL